MKLYSKDQIKSSISHFIFGKSLSAGLGIFTTVLIARNLSTEAYGTLTFFIGLALVTGSLSSIGLQHSYQRFAPELQVHGSKKDFIRFSFAVISIETAASLLSSMAVLILAQWVAEPFINEKWVVEVRYWAFVIFFMNCFKFSVILLESLMLQKITKWLMIGLSFMRLFLILFALRSNGLSLDEVIMVEFSSYVLASVCGFSIFYRKVRATSKNLDDRSGDLNILKRVIQFSMFNYFREMLFILSGTASNRLVVARFLSTYDLAAFGFAQNLCDIVGRYMPSKLLKNLLRPALMGRFSESGDYRELNFYANLIFKLNNMLLGALIVIVFTVGDKLLKLISGGRYPHSGWMLMLLMVWLFMNNHNQILEAHANAAEENKKLFLSTVINSAFIFLAMPLTYWFNVAGLVGARCIGLLFRDVFLAQQLIRKKIPYYLDWSSLVKMITACLVPMLVLRCFVPEELSWAVALLFCGLAGFIYIIAQYLLKPLNVDDRLVLNKLTGRKIL